MESEYIRKLSICNPIRDGVLRRAIESLHLPPGSRGLDAGCGIGFQSVLLSEAVAPGGHVVGLDISPAFTDYAREVIVKTGQRDSISFENGDINDLPFDDNSFDWAWSSDCVGYAPGDHMQALTELGRVVRPGGIVAITAISSQLLLPGYPALEARLNASAAGIAPFHEGDEPSNHFNRALGWFRRAGFDRPTARTFTEDVQAPLNEDLRSAVISFMEMRWENVQSEISRKEWSELKYLTDPGSKGFILESPGYHAFFAYSLYSGTVTG